MAFVAVAGVGALADDGAGLWASVNDKEGGTTMEPITVTDVENDPGTSWEVVGGVLSIRRTRLDESSEIVPLLDADLNPIK